MTETTEPTAAEGQRITTRYYGGYEGVKVVQVHPTYYVVSRFSGQATDILPKGHIEKLFDADKKEIYSIPEHDVHPALAAIGVARSS